MKKILLLVVMCLALMGCSKMKELSISLKGNPTTGYEWTYQVDKVGILKEVSNEYVPDENSNDMVGVGGTYNFVFEPVKDGKVTITFVYSRSFETEEPIYKVEYTYNVRNGKIKFVNSKGNYDGDIPDSIIK